MRAWFDFLKEKWDTFCKENGLCLTFKQQIGLGILFLFFLSGLGFYYYLSLPKPLKLVQAERELAKPDKSKVNYQEIAVHIGGEVKKPGVYFFQPGKRVIDALNKAGGAKKNANLDAVNLARKLRDGEKIIIPSKNSSPNQPSASSDENKLINLNTATQEELESLPGIGETLAKRIIEYREKNSGFQSIEELRKIEGIGKKKFAQIKDLITVE